MPGCDLVLKNYRCFPDDLPARLSLRQPFTALIGINNAGKSSILRFFYEFRPLLNMFNGSSDTVLNALRGQPQGFGGLQGALDTMEVFAKTNDRPIHISLTVDGQRPDGEPVPLTLDIAVSRPGLGCTAELFVGDRRVDPARLSRSEATLLNGSTPVADLKPFFHAFFGLSRAMYVGAFRNAINVGEGDYFDIQVGLSFIQRWRQYKAGPSIAANEAAYRLIQDVRRIFAYDALDINPSHDDKTLQLFVNGRSFKLNELGGGVSQFIVALANVAIRRPTYVLIDEPETSLHTTLQLDFLTTLASYATEGVIFSTHSVGLARAAAERIYALRRLADGRTEVRPYDSTPRLAEFLGELSFAGYRELGADKVLLTEGVTDVKALQQLLRLYKKDHQVLLLPLGGAALIRADAEDQLAEIKRITPHIFAVVDSERSGPGEPLAADRAGFQAACGRAGIPCTVLERRALDNYWSDRAVKKAKGPSFAALGPYDRLRDSPNGWAKADNWRIAQEMTVDELAPDLRQLLASL